MDFEEYNTSTSEERNENDINQIALASTRTLLNSDENDNVDWSETSVQSLTLTPCLVMNAIQGEIKCYNGITNLRRLEQMIGTWEIDIDVVENIKSDLYQLEFCISVIKKSDKGQKYISCIEYEKHCDDTVIEKNLLKMEASKLLSKLFIRTALKLGKVELNKLINERTHIVILEKALKMKDKLGIEVLLSSETDHLRKIRHITTNAEKAILIKLFEFEKELPEIANSKVLSKIQTVSSNWTAERVK
ncbi:10943_t:CDS:2 [Funneliformis geosporum]|uniref:10943_t:CDS:1 n=1 Tax=Funneliformis geosporum TaxID=1117311 RepID=A0A9W4SGX8_9GLOM|nr:10943_t:CDS:2 [Funneliformis geosporum]